MGHLLEQEAHIVAQVTTKRFLRFQALGQISSCGRVKRAGFKPSHVRDGLEGTEPGPQGLGLMRELEKVLYLHDSFKLIISCYVKVFQFIRPIDLLLLSMRTSPHTIKRS